MVVINLTLTAAFTAFCDGTLQHVLYRAGYQLQGRERGEWAWESGPIDKLLSNRGVLKESILWQVVENTLLSHDYVF